MGWLKFVIKALFCSHDFEFVRNIHGDEIIERGWKRSLWKCTKCEDTKTKPELHYPKKR